MSDEYIKKFYNEVNESLEGNYKIILEPNRNLTDEWIEYDQVKWELDESLQKLVNTLLEEDTIDFEEKVLRIYKYICLNYVYDDNVLYFFKKDSSDPNNIKYIAVDWYGRIIDKKWKENRKNHNRRVCYEFARFYAKAINEMLIGNDNCEAFMLGDKENLHYVVGLTGNEYSIILDPDDFNNIKDLTRLKLGLAINGIKILRDNSGKFQKAVDKFNQDKKNELPEVEKTRENLKDGNFIEYFKSVVEILKSYNIDSQGFYEYMKSIVEQEEIETEKVWKKINGDNEKRYARCSIFNLDSKTYLLDSVDKTLSIINNENLDKDTFVFNPEENEYPYYGG
jgi:DNA-binding transcriptional MerR regulator